MPMIIAIGINIIINDIIINDIVIIVIINVIIIHMMTMDPYHHNHHYWLLITVNSIFSVFSYGEKQFC